MRNNLTCSFTADGGRLFGKARKRRFYNVGRGIRKCRSGIHARVFIEFGMSGTRTGCTRPARASHEHDCGLRRCVCGDGSTHPEYGATGVQWTLN
jgi:hypothetical protein